MKAGPILVALMVGVLVAACGATSERDTGPAATRSPEAASTPTLALPTTAPPATRPAQLTPDAIATRSPVPTNLPTATAAAPSPTRAPSPAAFDKLQFLASLPLPNDAEIVPVTEGIDMGYRTRQSEPAIIALYTNWITAHGWVKATELPYPQPNERWTKSGLEFVVYITPKGAEGVAVINIHVRPQYNP